MRPASAVAGFRGWAVPARLAALERFEPWVVLVPLVAAQWVALAIFAAVVRHNGWLFYQGGDQTVFYTDAWSIGHGHIPEAEIGYGWSYVLSPIAAIFGANILSALPLIVLFQTIVLVPIAILCVYGIGARIGGRLLGYLAAALWVFAPFLSIPLWDQRYHAKFIEQFLPQTFGMTGMGDFPSMVALLVAGYFCIRALDTGEWLDAGLGGLAAGFAIGIKPANALFLAGPLLGFAAARRWRQGAAFGVALAPELLALALWKYRGLGHLPIITPAPKALAAGAAAAWPGGGGLPLAIVVSRYFHFDWWRMHRNYLELREFFWSVRLLQWLPLAGFIGAARRSWPKALLLAGWIGAFILVKGSSDAGSIESGILLRLFLPGFAPFLIFTAMIPLLLPTLGPRIWERFPLRTWSFPRRRALAIGAAVVFGVVPLLLFAALTPLRSNAAVKDFQYYVLVPADKAFSVDVRRTPNGAGELVSWKPPTSSASVFYRVYRSRPTVPAPDPTLPPGHDGIRCLPPNAYGHPGAADCRLEMTYIGVTRAHSFVDHPPAGAWTYRIGLTANWLNDTSRGDTMVLSGPGHLGKFH